MVQCAQKYEDLCSYASTHERSRQGTGEMAQWTKCLPSEYEDQNSDLWYLHTRHGKDCNPSTQEIDRESPRQTS